MIIHKYPYFATGRSNAVHYLIFCNFQRHHQICSSPNLPSPEVEKKMRGRVIKRLARGHTQMQSSRVRLKSLASDSRPQCCFTGEVYRVLVETIMNGT